MGEVYNPVVNMTIPVKFGGETEGMGEVYNPVVNMTIPVKFGGETEGMGEVYNPVVNMTFTHPLCLSTKLHSSGSNN